MELNLPGHVLAIQDRTDSWLTGGSLRDAILGKSPKDFDLATALKPEEIEAICRKHDWGFSAHGKSFLVSTVRVGDHDPVEIATLRTESSYSDGRRPDRVEYTDSIEADSNRRDFTMNAMYWRQGKLIDIHGGKADIEQELIRCVGNPFTRFSEDGLRILRCFRFAANLSFTPTIDTLRATERSSGLLRQIANERIFEELTRMLRGKSAWKFILDMPIALRLVLDPVYKTRDYPQYSKFHPEGNVLVHTAFVLRNAWYLQQRMNHNQDLLNWSALMHDTGKCCTLDWKETEEEKIPTYHGHEHDSANIATEFLDRLGAPNNLIHGVAWVCDNHMRVKRIDEMKKAKVARMLRHQYGKELIAVGACDHYGGANGISWEFYNRAMKIRDEIPVLSKTHNGPKFVNGKDLIVLGLMPGPIFKDILNEIEDAQLENPEMTEEETRQMLARLASEEMS